MKSNGIGCLGTILFTGAVVGAIGSFVNGNTGLGWFFVVVAVILPWPIGGAMIRANTEQYGALSAQGETAVAQIDQAVSARKDGDATRAALHWDNALRMLPGMLRRNDWSGLTTLYLVRYATLRADGKNYEAAELLAEWRGNLSMVPEAHRFQYLAVPPRAEALTDVECSAIAAGDDDADGVFLETLIG